MHRTMIPHELSRCGLPVSLRVWEGERPGDGGGDEPPRQRVAEHRGRAGGCRVRAAAAGVPGHPGSFPSVIPSAALLPPPECGAVRAAAARLNAARGRRGCVPAHAAPPALDACVQRNMVRLRLQRFGVRNNPFYRIVAADARWPRDGKHLELLGSAPRPAPPSAPLRAPRAPSPACRPPVSPARPWLDPPPRLRSSLSLSARPCARSVCVHAPAALCPCASTVWPRLPDFARALAACSCKLTVSF